MKFVIGFISVLALTVVLFLLVYAGILPEGITVRIWFFVLFGGGLLIMSIFEIIDGTAFYRTGENKFLKRSKNPVAFWITIAWHIAVSIFCMLVAVFGSAPSSS